MEIKDGALWKQATGFINACKGKRVHIIHDFDADGIAGGVFLYHALKKLGIEVTASTRKGRGAPLHEAELRYILFEKNPDKIIIVDMDPKSYHHWDTFREIFPELEVLIIDHHFTTPYDDAILLHPKKVYGIEGKDYCSSKLCYDLCDELTDTEELAWLACVGILGDMNQEQMREFLEATAEYEDFNLLPDAYDSLFGQVVEAVTCCASSTEEDLLKYVELLKQHASLRDVIKKGNPCSEIRAEVDLYVDRGLDFAETDGPITWLEIESEYSIDSWISTLISTKYPHRIFVCYRKQVDGYGASIRYQNAKVHTGEIVKKVAEKHGGTGGGHPPASGCYVPTKEWNAFRKEFSEEIEKALEAQER